MIFTFYSFKGGVGRSMAMAATAYLFAQRGLRVLAIDFDLEAPGLERYFFDDTGKQLERTRANPGLIDLVLAYKRALTTPEAFEAAAFKRWSRFVVAGIPRTGKGGSVDLLTAGRRSTDAQYADYALAVRNFDWQDFFHNWRGDRFFDWLRAELIGPEPAYDVVLVDSRTGVTEMGGICAYQLADVAVLLCAPNFQNLDGTRAVVDDFRSDAVIAVRNGRPLDVLVVPARVDQEDPSIATQRERFFAELEKRFGSEGLPKVLADVGLNYRRLTVAYDPDLAIIERLVDSEALTRGSFETLADALTLLTSGEEWARYRRDAVARLRGQAAPEASTIADVTRRGAGYDVLLYCGRDDIAEAEAAVRLMHGQRLEVSLAVDDTSQESLQRAVEQLLPYSRSLAVCVGRSSPGKMFRMLLREAEQRRLPVIPLLVRGVEHAHQAVAAHGISDLQWIDLRRDDHVGDLEHLTEMISAPQHVTPQVAAAPPNPYPGAAPFSEDQQQFFVGRDDELAALGEEFGRHDVVLLSGGSGVGKTSLVHAALVPFVRRSIGPFAASGTQGWVVRYSDASAAQTLDGFSPDAHDQTFCIVDHIDVFVERQPAEEWTRRAERIAALLRSGRQRGKVLLVWRESLPDTLRDEALRAWEAAAGSPPGRFALNKVPPVVLRRTLEEPSIKVGHLFEPGLLDRLVGDAGEGSGAIAQAQLAMADIWAERRQGWLTNKAYDAEGGIAGRFEKRLQAYLHQAGPDSAHIAELLLLRLIRFDTQLRTIAEARSWSDVASLPVLGSGHAERIRDALIAGRLIDVWRESSDAPMRCALAHGTVPPTLQALATSDVEFILWRERFATHLHSFVDADRASTALLSGDVLAEAERWASSRSDELTTVETELIAASREAREQERTDAARREEELARSRAQTQLAEVEATLSRRRTTVFRRAAWAVSVLAVLAFLAFVVALQNYRRASSLEERERLSRLAAQTGRLADRARDIRSRDNPEDLDLIALVAIEALRLGPSGDADLQIREAIRLLGQPLARLDHDGSMKFVGWGPTTDYVVALPEGREALVWKWTDFQVISRHAHTARINSIAVSSDGTTAATAAANGEVHVWPIFASAEFMNLQDHQALGSAPDQPRPGVNAVAFGAAGQLLATGSDDGMVRLWDLTTQRVMARAKHEASVHAVAFSRDDSDPVLVTAGDDGGARVWRLPDLQLLYRVPHPGAVTFLGFADERESGGLSPDRPRRLLVTGGFEGELKFWPVGALNPSLRLALRGDVVSAGSDADRTLTGLLNRFGSSAKDADVVLLSRTLARRVGRDAVNLLGAVRPAKRYSISGSGLVAMGPGRVAGVWEPEPGIEEARQERARLLHDGPVTAADLRDGMALTAGSDGIVRVWRLPENASRGEQAAFYSPDGQWRLSETADGSLGLERLPLQGEPHTLPVPFSQIFRVAFFQHRVAVVYMNRLALLDLRSETVLADVPLNDQDPVRTLAIAEGGVLVALARAVELRAPDTAAPLWRVDFSDPLEPMPVGIDPVSDELDVALLRDGTLQVWPRPRRTSYPLSVDVARSVRFMAFRPRRRQFAVCGDSRVAVVNTDNGRASWTSDIDAPCSAIAFDRSGNSLAVATFAGEAPPAFPPGEAGPRSRGILRVFEPDTAVRPPALESPLRIDRLAFTTDGAVVAGRAGNVVHVWDIPSEREVARIPVTASTPSAGVSFVDGRQLSFSQDNRYLHIGGTPTPWRPNDVIAEACQRLTRRLSAEEVRAHLPVDHVYTPACTIDRRVAAK